jgi:hypothetical protein
MDEQQRYYLLKVAEVDKMRREMEASGMELKGKRKKGCLKFMRQPF